jgi:hypothetical protein
MLAILDSSKELLTQEAVERKPSSWVDNPRGVVSLLDMLNYAAEVFCTLTEILGRIQGQPFGLVGAALHNDNYARDILSRLAAARQMCIDHGWSETGHRIAEVESYLMQSQMVPMVLQSKCADLESHVMRVLRSEVFYHADKEQALEFIEWRKATEALETSFPLCHEELWSAGMCYVCDQTTASVFHSMRALELGLTALAREVNVSAERDQWEKVITNIEAAIKKIDGPHAGSDWRRKQEMYSEVALHFRFVKNAWRNHVMHARRSYGLKKASEIWHHTTEFISDLSTTVGLKEPALATSDS